MTTPRTVDSTYCDHFSDQAADYALSRPGYPAELGGWLASQAPTQDLAWDVGTGSGQGAHLLCSFFDEVIATDASEQQLAHAIPAPNITYRQSRESDSGLSRASVSLVTAFQAAHWFDLESFYQEVDRIALPGAVCALLGYDLVRVDSQIDAEVKWLYSTVLGGWWPKERKLVENRYESISFPYQEIPFSGFVLEREWTRSQFLGYLGSWSAVQRYRKANNKDPMVEFEESLVPLWEESAKRVSWPLFGRVGYCG